MDQKIRLGVSSCLLGEKVRYDGDHQWDRYLTDTLGKYVDFVPVCPEGECGLGVPREAMRLMGDPSQPRLITVRTRQDHTERLINWAQRRVGELAREDLYGFIFKSGSPSSGMERVKVYRDQGGASKTGVGLFARVFMEYFPLLPVEDEGRLHDLDLRENFIERIFAFKRWRESLGRARSLGELVTFHTRHKLLILSHSPRHYRRLGNLVARGKGISGEDSYSEYQTLLMEALRLRATAKKHVNVLHHLLGYFKNDLSGDDKIELLGIIDQYRQGFLPLIVPITLINHYVRVFGQPYLAEQYYLAPHPLELQLRNHG
jgi:uncharacterized protein YbgA (DUF1722 family)/uncharacterized protein YbbK (DUF523 family)